MKRIGVPYAFTLGVIHECPLTGGGVIPEGAYRRKSWQISEMDGDYQHLENLTMVALKSGDEVCLSEIDIILGISEGLMALSAEDDEWPDHVGVWSRDRCLEQLVSNIRELRRVDDRPADAQIIIQVSVNEMAPACLLPVSELPPPCAVLFADEPEEDASRQALAKLFAEEAGKFKSPTALVEGVVFVMFSGDKGFTATASRMVKDITNAERIALVWNEVKDRLGLYGEKTDQASHNRGLIAYANGKGSLKVHGSGYIGESLAISLGAAGVKADRASRVEDIAEQMFKAKLPAVQAVVSAALQDVQMYAERDGHPMQPFAKDLLTQGVETSGSSGWGKPVQ